MYPKMGAKFMRDINLTSLLIKLADEYESIYGKMNFFLEKINNQFLITDIDQTLLQYLNIQKHSVVSKNVTDLIECEKTFEKLDELYRGNQPCFYYCTIEGIKDMWFLFIILIPIIINEVLGVEGRCLPIDLTSLKYVINSSDICKIKISNLNT